MEGPVKKRKRNYSPKRNDSPESIQGHEIVPIHPSHKGSTYQRRPKKKKKKVVKKESVVSDGGPTPTPDYEHYFLAPIKQEDMQ